MHRPLLSRLSGAIVALALGTTTLAAVGAATPASAAGASCQTKATISVYQSTVLYGGYERISGDTTITGCTGTNPGSIWSDAGDTVIERSLNNGATWQVVHDDGYSSSAYWYGDGIVGATALFRAHYTGGTSANFGDSYKASYSSAVRVSVIRNVDLRDKSSRAHSVGRFKMTPTTGLVGKKVVFQVKKGKKWKRYQAVKVRASGVWKTTFKNSRRGIKYRLVVPAAGGLSAYTYGPFTATRR